MWDSNKNGEKQLKLSSSIAPLLRFDSCPSPLQQCSACPPVLPLPPPLALLAPVHTFPFVG